MYVPIGGIEQWIQFNEHTPGKPVLLFLHGGPGGTSVPASAAMKSWEADFTLVHWDQRGSGRTFRRNGAAGCGPLSIDRMVADGLELADYLKSNLQEPKILLVGHSWGSALGVYTVQRRPELFSAFVGTGQLVNMRRNEEINYARQLESAQRRANQEALGALRTIGPPPYSDFNSLLELRKWTDLLTEGDGDPLQLRPSPLAPDFTAADVPPIQQGAAYSRTQLLDELNQIDLFATSTAFDIPMFCFQGSHDQQTPTELAEEWFTAISAPRKAFVQFAGCHHFVVINRPELFLQELRAHVGQLFQPR